MSRPNANLDDRLAAAEQAIARAPVSEDWAAALELVARCTGGWGCHLNRIAPDLGMLASVTGGIPDDVLYEFAARQGASPAVNSRAAAIYSAPLMRAVCEADFTDARTWTESPFYTDFLLKVDAPFSVFGKLFGGPKDAVSVTVLKSERQGHATDADKKALEFLLPGIQAASALQHSLDERGLGIAAQSLDKTGAAAIICDAYLNIISMTEAGEAALLNGDHIASKRGKIKIANDVQQRKLQRAAAFASLVYDERTSSSQIRVDHRSGGGGKMLAVAPAADNEFGMMRRGVLLLLLDENVEKPSVKPAVDLTNAEIEIGKMLIRGQTTGEIAKCRLASKATVQTQVKNLSAKFSVSHRAELLIALQGWFSR